MCPACVLWRCKLNQGQHHAWVFAFAYTCAGKPHNIMHTSLVTRIVPQLPSLPRREALHVM